MWTSFAGWTNREARCTIDSHTRESIMSNTARLNLLSTVLGLVLGAVILTQLTGCGGGDGAMPFGDQRDATTQPVNCNAQPAACH